jgi:hypothetical protein
MKLIVKTHCFIVRCYHNKSVNVVKYQQAALYVYRIVHLCVRACETDWRRIRSHGYDRTWIVTENGALCFRENRRKSE